MEYSHDDFWLQSSHRGFDFDTTDGFQNTSGASKHSTFPRNDSSNQFNPLKYDGLDEIADNSSSADITPFRISHGGGEGSAFKFTDNSNPLLIFLKKGSLTGGAEKTVKDMLYGLEYNLSEYKSKKDKLQLLEIAQDTHDGNTILEVVLYLRRTLKKSIFDREIKAFPDAFNVYLNYLEEDHENEELYEILQCSGKPEVAAFLKYEAAASCYDIQRKLHRIENCLSTHFQLCMGDPFHRLGIEEHYRLLKEQIEYYPSYMRDEAQVKLFEDVTGRKNLVNSSVLTSVIYACLFHYKSIDTSSTLTSPQQLLTNYHLTKKQFTWAALRALATLRKWPEIDDLFMTKNWLGSIKVRSCISFSRVLEVLYKAQAPTEVLSRYVSCVENEKEKLELAQKYGCHSVAIEVFKNNKDRLGLIKYKSVVSPHSPDLVSIIETLNNPAIRWKN